MTNLQIQEKNMIAVESALVGNDISKLSTSEKLTFYNKICESVGLNPLTKPFAFLKLQGREVLYATKDCTEQLRKIHGVSIQVISKGFVGDMYEVHVKAKDKQGKEDEELAYIVTKGLMGNDLANAMMKCLTKAKRRVTLSICGLGMLDESEIETIENVAPASNPQIQSPFKDVPQIDQTEQIDAVETEKTEDLGEYVVRCGHKYLNIKFKTMRLDEIEGYKNYLKKSSEEKNIPLTNEYLEFYEKATAYLESMKAV